MKTQINKPLLKFLPVAFIAAGSLFASCNKNNDASVNGSLSAKVKVVNTVDGSSAQDFYLDNVKLDASAVAYEQSSDYLAAKSGSHTAKFTNSGSTTANVSFNVSLQTDSNYTIYYTSNGSASSSVVTTDNLTAPAANMAKVRFINLSNAVTTNVDFGVSATSKLITNLAARAVSAYSQVTAGTTFYLYSAGSINAMLTIPATTIQAGKIYTIYISGSTTLDLTYNIVAEN
ncbi:DUF4397 domain-containing protein [Mucilaginibacter sp. E4BP6]|uniref:DUF4397 domain-containing protein n=1 Tax=Mucilaginibacter sp. E4BP6 TaxID=2723089 RepID=UPI0015C8BC0B|nr:DUF4397 domain-containing protein [Mucilaginibacter sp. E4BP6]NYE64676.1 hypothetical protein [Mucilaginibacter sp. E4BP6]